MRTNNSTRAILAIATLALVGTTFGQKKQSTTGPDYQSLVNNAHAKYKDLKEGKMPITSRPWHKCPPTCSVWGW